MARNPAFPRRWQWTILMAAIAIFLLSTLWLLWDCAPVDDAFITYRYARNFVAGSGIGFNPGERVEGYSSLSWLMILSAGEAVQLDQPALSKWLGLMLGLATLLLVAFGPFDAATRMLAVGLLAIHLPWVFHMINGMETALVSFLLTVILLLPANTRTLRIARLLCAALLAITRPEGTGLAILAATAAWFPERVRFRGHHLAVCCSALAALAGQTIWRWFYYGDWIANSARAKLLPLEVALPRGLEDLGRFAFHGSGYGGLALLAAVGVVMAARRRKEAESRRFLALVAVCILGSLALAASGGDSFPLWRFFVPLAPVWILVAARGLNLTAGSGRLGVAARIAATVLLALALGVFAARNIGPLKQGIPLAEHWKKTGSELAKTFPPQTRLALTNVGIVPYYSGLYTIDMLGLNEKTIARRPPDLTYHYPGHQRHDGRYVLGLEPDLIMLANGPFVREITADFRWQFLKPYERDLAADTRLRERYEVISVPLSSGGFVQIFASKAFLATSSVHE